MKIVLKNLLLIITIVAPAHHAQAMKNIIMLNKIQKNYVKKEEYRKTVEYAMTLLVDHYEMNSSISESALEKLRNMPWDEFAKHMYHNMSQDTYYNFLKYCEKMRRKKMGTTLIGVRNKDKEQHEQILNSLISVCEKLDSKKKNSDVISNVDNSNDKESKKVPLITDEDLENAIMEYSYDNDEENDKKENDISQNSVNQEKKNVDKKPTSPSINIIKTTKTYSPGKANYVPLKITKVQSPPKIIQHCNISFENKKVKKNYKKREEINDYLSNNNDTTTKNVDIIDDENKSNEGDNTILSRNPNTAIKNIKQYFGDN